MTVEAYPLCWPHGRRRTRSPGRALFSCTFAGARDTLLHEIRLLGGRQPVLSTNVALRRDGLPYANLAEPSDAGVAVYFTLRGQQFCFACDRWDRVRDNIQAVRHTIGALRGIERWGTGDMVQAAFTGFAALPSPGDATAPSWRTVLGFSESDWPSLEDLEARYRRRRAEVHPDRSGGSSEQFDLVQRAVEQGRQEVA